MSAIENPRRKRRLRVYCERPWDSRGEILRTQENKVQQISASFSNVSSEISMRNNVTQNRESSEVQSGYLLSAEPVPTRHANNHKR